MRGISCVLPPFAPDYGGICSVLYGGGGLVVIHDASGCTINFTTYDEPRWQKKPSKIFCSCLREMDAVLGDDDKLVKKVVEAARALNPEFIALVGSSVPMLIGTDLKGIAREIEAKTGIPSLGLNASGIDLFDRGASEAQTALLNKFANEAPAIKRGVGLLGDDALVLSGEENHRLMENALLENGLEPVASLGMGNCVRDVARLASCEVNLVVSASGLAPAEFLKKRFGTPYAAGFPMGTRGSIETANRLRRAAAGEETRFFAQAGGKALLLGESLLCAALREALALDYGITGLCVGNIFSPLCPRAEKEDLVLSTEEDVLAALRGRNFRAVVADPAFRPLVPEEVLFVPLPSVAVSGGIYGREKSAFTKENLEWIAQQLKEVLCHENP